MPLPRRPGVDLLKVPVRLRGAVREATRVLDRTGAEVVVGFGGYVSMPAYLAARRRRVPIVLHEQNAVPGLANKAGARIARRVAVSFPGTPLPKAEYVGLPLRAMIATGSTARRSEHEARRFFDLDPDRPTLLVTGGSQGARRLNQAVSGASAALAGAGVQVLHVVGPQGEATPEPVGGALRRAAVRRPHGPRLRRRRPGAVARRREQRHRGRRGRASRRVRAAADRQRRAGAQRPPGRRRRGSAARARRRPDLGLGREPRAALATDPARLAAMGAAASRLVPATPTSGWPRIVLEVARRSGRRGVTVRVPVPDVLLPAEELGRVHFVGIGGAGLSAIARIMLARGLPVSGSDGNDTPILAALRELGVTCYLGYAADHVGDVDTLVVSTAVRDDNPEVLEGSGAGCACCRGRPGCASVMAGRRVVAVAGTHGKTTTTSLLTSALSRPAPTRRTPSAAMLAATGHNAEDGTGDLFVVEADESDGAFLVYRPLRGGRHQRRRRPPRRVGERGGLPRRRSRTSSATVDPRRLPGLLRRRPRRPLRWPGMRVPRARRVVTVGEAADADVRGPTEPAFAGASFDVDGRRGDDVLGARRRCRSPAATTSLDALAALAAGLELGYSVRRCCARGWRPSPAPAGGWRPRVRPAGVRVYDSYAHHPAEIAADLDAARAVAGEGRLVVAFQPHLVSRTREFGPAMGAALGAADEVVVLDVYAARETPDPSVTGRLVADAVPLPAERVAFVEGLDEAAAELAARARDGDLVLTLGAGSVTEVGPQVLAILAADG